MTEDDMQVSARVAAEAGQLLLQLRESFGSVDDKDRANELRKAADRASHELIVARLAESRPDDAVLSEEGADDPARLEADRVWIVDPLDGTWEFGQGRTDFAVHVVLWNRDSAAPGGGRLTAGTVDLPAQGVSRQVADAPLPPRGLPEDRPVRIVASRTRPPATLDAAVALLAESLATRGHRHGVEVMDVGSVGAKVNEILTGRAEAYVHDTGFYEWDVAAPLSVAHAQGLVASHIDASAIAFNQPRPYVTDLLVGIPSVADGLREAMRRAADGSA
ncbi:MAG: 3'(2'),5'-bisphosphate nucleotidase CysQ [Actinomycetota bacterium]